MIIHYLDTNLDGIDIIHKADMVETVDVRSYSYLRESIYNSFSYKDYIEKLKKIKTKKDTFQRGEILK